MEKQKTLIIIISATIIMVVAGLGFLWHRQLLEPGLNFSSLKNPVVALGLVYIPVTGEIAGYYKLESTSGALVTQVTEGGLMDKAGIKAGDVITVLNGTKIGKEAPLLGVIRTCCNGPDIRVEYFRDNIWNQVEFQMTDAGKISN